MAILRLRDGTRLRVKDGADYDAIVKKYYADKAPKVSQETLEAQRAADREEYNPTKGMGTGERLLAGIGGGMLDIAQGAGNMLGLVDDETIAEREKLDAPLEATRAGGAGKFVGRTVATGVATLPLSLLGTPAAGASALTRTLQAGAGNVALQGAIGGALGARPNERGVGATIGALTGAGTYGVLKGVGKLAQGLIPISDDARAVQNELGEFIPLHLAADDSTQAGHFAKTLYGIAKESPLDLGMLDRQSARAVNAYVAKRGAEAIPKGLGLNVAFTADDAAGNFAKIAQVDDAVNAVTAPIKGVIVKVAKDGQFYKATVAPMLKRVARKSPQVADEIQKTLDDAFGAKNGEATLESVLSAISKLKTLRNSVGGTNNATGAGGLYDDAIKALENLGRARLKGAAKLPHWEETLRILNDDMWKWQNFKRGMASAQRTKTGKFTPNSILRGLSGQGVTGQIPGQQSAVRAAEVLTEPNIGSGFRAGVATGSAGALIGAGAAGGIPGLAATATITPLMATETAQRILSGQLGGQKALAAYLRTHPNAVRDLASRLVPAITPQGN